MVMLYIGFLLWGFVRIGNLSSLGLCLAVDQCPPKLPNPRYG